MQLELLPKESHAIRLTLSPEEARYLKWALERATFLDTPPEQQQGIYHFAEGLLRGLQQITAGRD